MSGLGVSQAFTSEIISWCIDALWLQRAGNWVLVVSVVAVECAKRTTDFSVLGANIADFLHWPPLAHARPSDSVFCPDLAAL